MSFVFLTFLFALCNCGVVIPLPPDVVHSFNYFSVADLFEGDSTQLVSLAFAAQYMDIGTPPANGTFIARVEFGFGGTRGTSWVRASDTGLDIYAKFNETSCLHLIIPAYGNWYPQVISPWEKMTDSGAVCSPHTAYHSLWRVPLSDASSFTIENWICFDSNKNLITGSQSLAVAQNSFNITCDVKNVENIGDPARSSLDDIPDSAACVEIKPPEFWKMLFRNFF